MEQKPGQNIGDGQRGERGQIRSVASVNIFPGIRPDVLVVSAEGKKAIVCNANALGALPKTLHDTVRQLTDQGIVIFVLPDNAGEDHGVIRVVDASQRETLASGAVYLEKANINRHDEVLAAIQRAIDDGKSGPELADAIRQEFAYKEGETKPVSRLGTEEGLAQHEQEMSEITDDE